jgi:putative transposase
MTRGYDKSQTSVYFMNYHFIWCPKYRRAVLKGQIAKRVEQLIKEKCKELHCEILTLAIQPDHIHIFLKATPTISPNLLIGQIKGYTSRMIRQEFPDLKKRMQTLWTRSYFVSTHGHISDEQITKYINEQKGAIYG